MFVFIDKEEIISVNTENVNSIIYYKTNDGMVNVDITFKEGPSERFYTTFMSPEYAAELFHERANPTKES